MSTDLHPAVAGLEPLIGDWTIEVSIAPLGVHATCSFEPVLGGAFVLQRSEVPDPFPSGLCVLAPNGPSATGGRSPPTATRAREPGSRSRRARTGSSTSS
jgi:hypothetical protein